MKKTNRENPREKETKTVKLMDRKPKERKIGTVTAKQMSAAVDLVLKDNYSIRAAAERLNIKFQTLHRYVTKKRRNPDIPLAGMAPNYAVRRIFSAEQDELGEYITKCSKMAYGISTKECRKLAFEMAIRNNIKVPDSWHVCKSAGVEWMRHFLKRRRNISIRQPEACSLSRLTSFSPYNVGLFFDNLESVLRRIPQVADGNRIFNLDESGVTTAHKPRKILAEKGSKQVNQCTSAGRGALVTICSIVSAAGTYLPPALVFPRKYFKAHMLVGAPAGSLGLANPSGWMTSDLFIQVLDHFIKFTNSCSENPTLLIYDNHESHISLATVEKPRKFGVNILTLPPHCSHRIQPLDVSVFRPFKSYYNATVDSWMLRNPGIPMTIYQVAECVGEAHPKAFTPANIIAGFKRSGIYPLNRSVSSEADFLNASVTDRPIDLESPSTSFQARKNDDLNKETNKTNLKCDSTDNTEKTDGKRKTNRKPRQRGKSKIITDSPEKHALIEKEKEKELNTRKGMKKTKRVLADWDTDELKKPKKPAAESYVCKDSDSSDSDNDISVTLADSSGDENYCFPDVEKEPDFFEQPEINDFVLVEFPNKIFYIAKVISEIVHGNEYEVSFLRKCRKMGGCFVFPAIPDMAAVQENEIKWVLPKPNPVKNKRLINPRLPDIGVAIKKDKKESIAKLLKRHYEKEWGYENSLSLS
ncbi:hypothetical protein ILUMI_22447 [Ignelater luminosus]|uniref:DDE-1 domain-containing protein n=1 Tax=Ignelater luminosus TaxID=2038154 RepID=A0A8K0CAM4_IGNLU|nr:hypothetical protein ILUMI_22447 [Ignelater luminosus]